MSWFEKQLRYREQKDNDSFEEALIGVAEAVMGRKMYQTDNNFQNADSAVDEILKYYHCKLKKVEIPSSIKTLNEQLDYKLRPYGIMRREVQLDKGFSKRAIGPMLGKLKENGSPVALIPHKLYGYVLYDPSTKKVVHINGSRKEKLLDTEAIYFYETLPLKKLKMKDLFFFMCKQLSVSDFVVYFGLMLFSTFLGLLMPLFTKHLFGTVLDHKSVTMLLGLGIYIISYSLCKVLFGAYESLKKSRIGTKQSIAIEAAVMNRVMSLPTSFFKEYSSGELFQRTNYVESLCNTVFSTVVDFGFGAVFSFAYFGQIFEFAPSLVIPSVFLTILSSVIGLIVTFRQMKITKESMEIGAKTSGMTYSMISGVQKIKLSGSEKRMFSRWAKNYSESAKLSYNPPLFLKLSSTITMAVSVFGTLLLYFIAIENKISVSDYYAFNTSYGMISSVFSSLTSVAITIAGIKPVLDMAKPILEAVPENDGNKEIVTSLNGNIELSDVSFRYNENMPYVLDGINLKIKHGEYLGIVGATGCGKSTLLRLLLGFETPDKGTIFYDQKDIRNLDMCSVRQKIGTVMQDGKLFFGDLYSNITITSPNLTLNEAWEAAEKAMLADDIKAMPMGMNTIISEGQGGISGGQRQRIMIARAIASKPKILMFDEATSALDNITQKKVSEAIDELNCTRIVIAHRLSTIKHCDRIIVLDKGRIVEEGTYEDLINKNGFFAELMDRQRISNEM